VNVQRGNYVPATPSRWRRRFRSGHGSKRLRRSRWCRHARTPGGPTGTGSIRRAG